MSVLTEQIAKARERAQGLNLDGLADRCRDLAPEDVADAPELAARLKFLGESLGDRRETELAFERIIGGNELQPVNYLQLGQLAARSVCRIKLFDSQGVNCGWASGFLVAPEVLLTNNHVFPDAGMAARAIAQFDVELDVFGVDKPTVEFACQPTRLFHTSANLDFSVSAISPVARSGGRRLSDYGFLPLIGEPGKVVEGEWLTIVQHPGGERKQVCIRENQLLTRTDEVLWYSTDTQGGSSGSPVFNNSWQVVALHHKGVPQEKNGRIQTLDGRDYDPGRDDERVIKWIANEGIRVSRIVQALSAALPDHPLLADVFHMTPARARDVTAALLAGQAPDEAAIALNPAPKRPADMSRSVTVTLDIADDGRVSVRGSGAAAVESLFEKQPPKPRAAKPAATQIDAPFDDNYKPGGPRKGYLADYLGGGFEVPLPDVGPGIARLATPKLTAAAGSTKPGDYVLDYLNYSLMMHARRRLAIYTAANVNGGDRFELSRPTDEWRYDPRIPREAQLGGFYYKNNQFDRGHLTRREDMEYGASALEALQSAADTCHWANCTPQHSAFNQNKETWQGLERHILESAIKANRFAAQVFTGPVLEEDDPTWDRFPDFQYPVRFWKVAVALTASNKLFAAGFILDQSQAIAEHGIEAAVEVPFGAFKTYQVKIEEIEALTGLTFSYGKGTTKGRLRDLDPMATPEAQRRTRRVASSEESFGVGGTPAGYLLLSDPSMIVRPED